MKNKKFPKKTTISNSMNRIEKMLKEQGIKRGTLMDTIKFIRWMAEEGHLSDSGMCIKLHERYLKKDWFTGKERMTLYMEPFIYLTENQARAINKKEKDSREVSLEGIQVRNDLNCEWIDIPVRKYKDE